MYPPCSQFSRALWHDNKCGVRVRNRAFPWGVPDLAPSDLQRCHEGSEFVLKTMAVARAQHAAGGWILSEHPEDLGAAKLGVPASIWALQEMRDLTTEIQAHTGAPRQCTFSADYEKPTRLWGTVPFIQRIPAQGWPVLDSHFKYKGPLIGHCGHKHTTKLIGHNTAPAAA